MSIETRAPSEDSSQGLGKISEQKEILGPGPADLRFSELTPSPFVFRTRLLLGQWMVVMKLMF